MADKLDPKFRRKLTTARREILKAVEQVQDNTHKGVEFRKGHRMEMVRQTEAIRDEIKKLIEVLDGT